MVCPVYVSAAIYKRKKNVRTQSSHTHTDEHIYRDSLLCDCSYKKLIWEKDFANLVVSSIACLVLNDER